MNARTPRIVLIGHAGCPGSERARAHMLAHGIDFEEVDVADPAAVATMRHWGAWATPLIVVGGRVAMVGFDPAEFTSLLVRAGGG